MLRSASRRDPAPEPGSSGQQPRRGPRAGTGSSSVQPDMRAAGSLRRRKRYSTEQPDMHRETRVPRTAARDTGGYLRIAADQRWLQTVIRFRARPRAKRRLGVVDSGLGRVGCDTQIVRSVCEAVPLVARM